MDVQDMTLDNLLPFDRGQINFELLAEQLYKFLHFLARRELLVLLDFDELDVKPRKYDLADVKIEFILHKNIKIVDVARVMCIDCDSL